MLFQLPYDLDGPLLGGAGRQLDLADDEPLIFVRQERRGKVQEEKSHGGHNGAVDYQVAHRLAEGAADDPLVLVPAEFKCPVEVAEEPGKPAGLTGIVPLCDRLEDGSAEGRGQDHGHQDREDHGGDDGDGELAVDDAGGAGKEGHGEEDRRQYGSDAPEGTGYLPHGLDGRFFGRQPFLGHDPLHVFNDDDGVIHQQADDNDQGEHGQGVDGEPAGRQHPHGAQENHRHGNGGDQGGTDVLQEKEHDDKDQKDRNYQGLNYLCDGDLDKGSGVVGIDDLHAGREVPGQFLHLGLDPVAGFQGIGPCCQADRHAPQRLAVVVRLNFVVFGADLAFGYIPELDRRAVAVG